MKSGSRISCAENLNSPRYKKYCGAQKFPYISDSFRGDGSMRLKLTEWAGSSADRSLSARGMDRSEIEALIQHGKYERVRPIKAVMEMVSNFIVFCRWRGEVYMSGHRVGPVHKQIFHRPRTKN